MAKKSKSSKKTTAQRLAPIGLWISLVGLVAAVGLLFFKLFVGFTSSELPNADAINLALWISLGLLVIGPALYALLNPQRVREFLAGRQARHGSNALILTIAFLLILFIVNLLTFQNPKEWDWTADDQNTLAPETLDTLAALPSPAQAIGFYTSTGNYESDIELLARYRDNSGGNFDYEIVNPDENPVKAEEYGVTGDATVVVILEDRHETLSYVTEQNLTSALVRLMNPGERSVYFLTGHGELDINGSDDYSYAKASSVLEAKNYTVKSLNLRTENAIPADALAIIIPGPIDPITAEEMPLLIDYLNNGGSVILLAEPMTTTVDTDPLTQYLSTNWGITLDNDYIVDPSSSQAWIAVANSSSNFASHAITEKLATTLVFFPSARSITVGTAADGVEVTPLILSSSSAWGETDFASIEAQQVYEDASTDVIGPLLLAAAAENSSTGGRVVVICDSDFASDSAFEQYGNGDLFANSVDWAAGQENMINLTVKTPTDRQFNVPSTATLWILAFAFICLVPGLIIGGGVTMWLTRRARG